MKAMKREKSAVVDSRRASTAGDVPVSTKNAKSKSARMKVSKRESIQPTDTGFHYEHSSSSPIQPSTTRYPPWERSSFDQSEETRPLTSQVPLPVNFIDYHFRSALASDTSIPASVRDWEHTGLGSLINSRRDDATFTGNGLRFTLMCYNILAPKLLYGHPELYSKCVPEHLDWDYRRNLIFQEIEKYAPDIICFQEVQSNLYKNTLESSLSNLGFKGVYKKKTGSKVDGCAIFYRASRFFLLDKLEVEFCQKHIKVLDRDNIGLLVKLETRNVPRRQKIVVGTTHLLFNLRREDVRLAQIQLLLTELDRIAFAGFDKDGTIQYHPILLTGDLNSKPYSLVNKFLSEGRLRYKDENGDLLHELRRNKRTRTCLMPRHSGISDQCQHYRIILERYKKWRSDRNSNYNFEPDLGKQESLLNLFPYLEARGFSDSENGLQKVKVHTNAYSSPDGDDISTLLSPPTPAATTTTSSFMEVVTSTPGEVDAKLLVEAAEKAAFQVNSAGANASNSTSREELYFPPPEPESPALIERHLLNEIGRYNLTCDFETGLLSHNFNFRDIYAGRLDRFKQEMESGVTSKQNGWTCVDYIYQSMTWHNTFNKLVEGKLKLIRRLGLYTRNECKDKNIPNDEHPSDHFPLVAEFLLRH